jgi:tetratricopeptide (TPR) repeat protein
LSKKKKIQKGKPQKVKDKKLPAVAKISKQQLLILFCMLIAIFIAYLPALHKDFFNYDDIRQNLYITNFSFAKIPIIFSHFYKGQYAPVPFLIYGFINIIATARTELFIYNFVSVVLHLITIILVFKLIWSLCSNFRIAFITAALFGVATIQVESVAWLAAVYKTCTYSIFFLSSLIAYTSYIKTNRRMYFIVSLLLFIISCFCKEQAVSLALAVVAIDIFFRRKLFSKKVIFEKIPFFLISLIWGLITIAAANSFQEEGINITSYSITDRVIYESYALCCYIYKLLIPVKLSLWYPYFSLENTRLLYLVFPLLLLIIAGFYGYSIKKKSKYIIFGGLFFLLNILFSLALQIISVRPTFMADRYVYMASIGTFFIVAKGLDILVEKKLIKLPVMAIIFVAFFLGTAYLTYGRNKIWKNSMAVWNDVISKNQNIASAYYYRGIAKNDRGDLNGAIDDFDKAIAIRPNYALVYNIRGVAKNGIKDFKGAVEDYDKAIAIFPNNEMAFNDRGTAKYNLKDFKGAIDDYNKAIAIRSDFADAYYNKGILEYCIHDLREAIICFNKAIELDPVCLKAYINRAITKYNTRDLTGAINDCDKVLQLNPDDQKAQEIKAKAQKGLQNLNK